MRLGRTLMPWQAKPQTPPPLPLKITAHRGRLVVTGPGSRIAKRVPGAIYDSEDARRAGRKRKSDDVVWLSLTVDSLRALRKVAGVSSAEFARWCAADVVEWARAAARSEEAVDQLHRRIADGYRTSLPWVDKRADTPAPATAPREQTYVDPADGVRRWSYRAPFDHQQVMATAAAELDGVAYLCEMGTGKTRAAVEATSHRLRADEIDLAVVVCPKGVMGTWERECANWAQGLVTERLTGRVVKRRERIEEIADAARLFGSNVLILNYDVLHLLEADLKRLCKRLRVGLVLDEGHRVRNPQAKVTKAAMRLSAVARWRLHMTGTPILQGAHDVWSQWYVVDLGVTFGANWVQFRKEFFEVGEYDRRIDPLDGTLGKIGQKLRRRGLRYRKADCLDLPPKLYQTVEVEMTPKQQRAYAEMEEWLLSRLEDGESDSYEPNAEYDEEVDRGDSSGGTVSTAANQLAMILRLTQITSGFLPSDDGAIHRFVPNPKLDALAELVEEQIGSQQIIVWARYREDVRAICERLAQYAPLVIDGSVKQTARDEAERLFQAGERRLLVANPAAGGVGLNLQAASLAVYYSQGYSLEHRLQSEDRCHRSGSERHEKVTYVDLVAKETIDEVVLGALADKKDVAEIVVDLREMLRRDVREAA